MTRFPSKKIISLLIVIIASIFTLFRKPNLPKAPLINKNEKSTITPTASQSAQLVKVTRVIDGDTIEIEGRQKVRYIGMDTPELHHPKKPVQCFGREAMEKNRQLVDGEQVRLEKDVSETDKYGRLLRYVYLEDTTATSEAIFVNDYLVREGFAFAATFPPDVKYADLFRQSQNEARNQNKGLWNKCK